MNAHRIGRLVGVATLIASGAYVFIYLYRWEWNRAQVSAAIFLMAEVALVGAVLGDRLRRVERQMTTAAGDRGSERRLHHLRAGAPPSRVNFAWLSPTGSTTNVFIPVLLGAGVLMSGLAWVVERLARATAGRAAEQGLASRLAVLEPADGGLLAVEPNAFALLRGPVR